MDARQLFLTQHAHLHASATSGMNDVSFQDGLCEGLTDLQVRERPDGLNSIAWLLWHITRFEDVVVNTVLRGAPEVFDRDDWRQRLGISSRLAGTGSDDDELREFGEQIIPDALLAYRAAVGRETRAWAAAVDSAALDVVPDVAARLAQAPVALDERAAWVPRLWSTKTGYGLLALPVLDHGHIHLGEARVTRSRVRAPRG
jgi:hypothetical protein